MGTLAMRRVIGIRISCFTCRRLRPQAGEPTFRALPWSSTTAKFRNPRPCSSCPWPAGRTEQRRRFCSGHPWASSQQCPPSSHFLLTDVARCYVGGVNLIDSVAQCRAPFVVQDRTSGRLTILNNAAECAARVAGCRVRYVLSDDLTQLCADLAYSRGARTVACADLLHVPAETLWVEWCNEPWQNALQQYGFPLIQAGAQWVGRRGAWIRSSRDGRRGLVRTFWSATAADVLASSVEAYFDFDTAAGEEPDPIDLQTGFAGRVHDSERADDDILGRCFRFRYEQSW